MISASGQAGVGPQLAEVARALQCRLAGLRGREGEGGWRRNRDRVGAQGHTSSPLVNPSDHVVAVVHAQRQDLALPDLRCERQALQRE